MADRDALRFLGWEGHWDEWTASHRSGAFGAVLHLSGQPSELASARQIVANWLQDNRLDQGISDPRVEVWDHFTRLPGQAMDALPATGTWFADRLDAAYRDMPGNRDLFRNDLFVTVVLHPEGGVRRGLRSLVSPSAVGTEAQDRMEQDFRDLMDKVEAGLARYGLRRLGLRHGRSGGEFSEILEAWHLIANNRHRPIALSANSMGRLVVPARPVFGSREVQIVGEHGDHFVAVLTFLDYPGKTRPTMFDDLRSADFGFTLTNARRFEVKAKALGRLSMRIKQKVSGNDPARSQVAQLLEDENAIADGVSVPVQHHFSLAVHASSLADLDRAVAKADTLLANAGVTAVRETDALKPAFYAQLPPNLRWSPRRAPTKSINAAALAGRNNVPRGRARGRWGAPIVTLRTTADTAYDFHFHVQGSGQFSAEDLGSTLVCGPPGSGKTSLLAGVCLFALRVPGARVVVIDNQLGLSVAVGAAGGSYLELRSGVPSGAAPLKALTASPGDLAFLNAWVRALILSDGLGELSSAEDDRLTRAIARQMQMPPEMRCFAGVQVMLGQRKRDDGRDNAAARLNKWCRGQRLGWAFDGDADGIDMGRRVVGFDTTALLGDEAVCSPMLAYIFYRTRKLIDGRPLVLVVDEAWQIDRVPAFSDAVKDELATIRKNEGVVLLATQSAHTFLISKIGFAYKQQVPTKIFFADNSAERADLIDGMKLTEAEYETVTQVLPTRKHTFLVQRPGGSVVCRFDLSGAKEKIAVLSARRATHELMRRLIARHGDDPRAWVPHFEREAPHIVDEPTLERPAAPVLQAAE